VTGLIVVDTAEFFTAWGQAYVLLLIQLGGLGVISFTSLIIVALGRRLSLRTETLAAGGAELTAEVDNQSLLRSVFVFPFAVEAVGAAVLYTCWGPRFGWVGAVWPSVFHAVSAFCNAGFSTSSTSLMGFQTNAPLLLTVMVLIVLGGIGFLTLEELSIWGKSQRRRPSGSGRPTTASFRPCSRPSAPSTPSASRWARPAISRPPDGGRPSSSCSSGASARSPSPLRFPARPRSCSSGSPSGTDPGAAIVESTAVEAASSGSVGVSGEVHPPRLTNPTLAAAMRRSPTN